MRGCSLPIGHLSCLATFETAGECNNCEKRARARSLEKCTGALSPRIKPQARASQRAGRGDRLDDARARGTKALARRPPQG